MTEQEHITEPLIDDLIDTETTEELQTQGDHRPPVLQVEPPIEEA